MSFGTEKEFGDTDNADLKAGRYWHLFVVIESDRPFAGGSRFPLDGIETVLVGRDPKALRARRAQKRGKELSLLVSGGATSREHARLNRVGDAWFIADAGSTHGTFVNGVRIAARTMVRPGDLFQVGHAFLMLRESALDARGASALGDAVPLAIPTLLPYFAVDLARLNAAIRTNDPIAIVGETGTGKEVLSRAIHELSGREGPLIGINCATLVKDLAESQLFGHAKGAFSGAGREEPGFFRSTTGGTILFDEILDLDLSIQAKLLRVIQERTVVPLGTSKPIRVDARVIAATQRRFDEAVAAGRFRADLQERLEIHSIDLPPLRERREDMGLLTAAVLTNLGAPEDVILPSRAVVNMMGYSWPRNVRQFENVLRRALLHRHGRVLSASDFPVPDDDDVARPSSQPLSDADRSKREELRLLLVRHRGNGAAVAREIGAHREVARRLFQRFGLDAKTFRAPEKGRSSGR